MDENGEKRIRLTAGRLSNFVETIEEFDEVFF